MNPEPDDVITTFAELADLMEPDWKITGIRYGHDGVLLDAVELRLTTASLDYWLTWNNVRDIPGTFEKFVGNTHGDTQTIRITLRKP